LRKQYKLKSFVVSFKDWKRTHNATSCAVNRQNMTAIPPSGFAESLTYEWIPFVIENAIIEFLNGSNHQHVE
jgi:hypothetical protein